MYCGWVTFTDTVCQVFFSMLPYYFTVYIAFQIVLPRHSQGLYGELSFGFPSKAAVLWQISFGPLPHPKIHHRVNIDGIATNARNCLCLADIWWFKIECFYTAYPTKMCTGMTWCSGKCRGQPTYWRHWERCYFAIVQNSSTSIGVGSSFFLSFALVEQMCHCQLGPFIHRIWAGWPSWSWVNQFMLLWWWGWYALQLAFGWPVNW